MKIQASITLLTGLLISPLVLGCGSEVVPTGEMGGSTGWEPPPPGMTVNPDPTTPDPTTPDPTTPETTTGMGGDSTGDDPTTGDDTTGGDPPDDPPDNTPVQPYSSCTTDDECGGDMACVDMLGISVCTNTGCAEDESVCAEGATCMTNAIYTDGVCTNTGSDQFCALSCRDILMCNLDPQCAAEGCCNEIDNAGCPAGCGEKDPMECEIAPSCPVECCG